jgi:hypothetical protein
MIEGKSPRQIELEEAGGGKTGRPWWQTCRLEDFAAICETKPLHELDALVQEIRSVTALLQSQIEALTLEGDPAGRMAGVRRAHGYIVEKSRTARGIRTRRGQQETNEYRENQQRCLQRARECVEANDLPSAILALIEVVSLAAALKAKNT